jgi:hypothetical protein
MATQTGMNLSQQTLTVLKNFATINSNIYITEGNEIKTVSPMKNIMATSTIDEEFEQDFGIWDLNKLLGTVSLFNNPMFIFEEDYLLIEGGGSSVKYYYSDPRLLTVVNDTVNMPKPVVSFELTNSTFNDIMKASSVLQLSDLTLRSNNSDIELVAIDKTDITSNNYSIVVGDNKSNADFSFFFKAENLKILPGDYNVQISDKGVSQFTHQDIELDYWIALESDSKYTE